MSIICILAVIAINIDSLLIGVAYGIAKIHMSFASKAGISLATGIVLSITVLFGSYFANIFHNIWTQWLAAILLLIFGSILLICSYSSEDQILNNPEKADSNSDKIISFKEALLLGIALSVDSLGAGFSLGLMEDGNFLIPAAVFVVNILFLTVGECLGKMIQQTDLKSLTKIKMRMDKAAAYIPGVLLIILGFWKILECCLLK